MEDLDIHVLGVAFDNIRFGDCLYKLAPACPKMYVLNAVALSLTRHTKAACYVQDIRKLSASHHGEEMWLRGATWLV